MHAKIATHTMPRAVQIIQSFTPKRLTSQDINLRTTGTSRELAAFNLDMPFQHQCIDTPLLFCKRPEGDGTGDVGGAVLILGTAIQQQESCGM